MRARRVFPIEQVAADLAARHANDSTRHAAPDDLDATYSATLRLPRRKGIPHSPNKCSAPVMWAKLQQMQYLGPSK